MASAAYAIFFRERNRVDFYPDAFDGLQRIAARLPVAALTNGNADLAAVGIASLFQFQLGAREFGVGKPEPGIFLETCRRLEVEPHEVLHVGDHPQMDVGGAARAGLRSCWIDRGDHEWPQDLAVADLHFTTLTALADWLDSAQDHENAA
jgi:putative hydrolase of the HAD superfamily